MQKALALLVVLALAVGGSLGCVTSSTTTDGDRQVVHQSKQAIAEAAGDLKAAQTDVPEGSKSWTMIGLGLAKLADAQRGMEHLQVVHGPPAEPKLYSKEEMDRAIAQSTKEHEESNVGRVLVGIGGFAAGIAGAYFGMPWLSQIFPKMTGKVGELAKTGVEIITAARQKAEESGGSISVRDLLKIAKEYNASAGVDAMANKAATAFEEKLGFKPTIKLLDAQTPSPVPAAA